MRPFEFIILFFSFVYTLALTHLLFAVTRMIRHRRSLVFSWPHALWMAAILLVLANNWLTFWDFHELTVMGLPVILIGFAICIGQYFVCALVSPDFDDGESYNLRNFYRRERRTWILALGGTCLIGAAGNVAAGAGLDIQNWAAQNAIVPLMLLTMAPPLFTERRWVAVVCPLALIGLMIAFPIIYYPALR